MFGVIPMIAADSLGFTARCPELEEKHVPDRLDQLGRSVCCWAATTAPDYAIRHTTSGSYHPRVDMTYD